MCGCVGVWVCVSAVCFVYLFPGEFAQVFLPIRKEENEEQEENVKRKKTQIQRFFWPLFDLAGFSLSALSVSAIRSMPSSPS